jgi:2-methylcitrate dehydratase PrpD
MTAVARHSVPRSLAEWACERKESPLASELQSVFRSRLLDFAANVVGGAAMPASLALRPYVLRFPGPVPVPGGGTAGSEAAALAYGVAAHSLECDDTHQPSSSHPGAVVFPAALALAVELDASVAALANAVVAGYEVMCRIGTAAGPANQYARGFHPTGTCGVFGAATAAGLLLDLDADKLAAAIGLAASCSSGSMSFLAGGGWSKLLNAGHAASAGVTVARLASLGYDGPDEAIVGPHGFLAGHAAAERLEALDGDDPLAIERTSVKAHGCCRYEQGPIDAILALRREHDFGAGDVESVQVGMLGAGWGIVAEPLDAKRRPTSVVESQFSMPFGAALALVHGRAAPGDHSEANLADPELLRVCDLVECYRDPLLDELYPGRWPAAVRIRLRDGRELEARLDHPKGDPENPLDDGELLDKLRALAPAVEDADVAALRSLTLERDLDDVAAAELVAAVVPLWSAADRGRESRP